MYCKYYQAEIIRKKTWFLSAVLRNESNVAFARAFEQTENSIWEFFVPEDQDQHFLKIIKTLERKGIVASYKKMENRLKKS